MLAGCLSQAGTPLWPGSKYSEVDRTGALLRALEFIHRSSSSPGNFDSWASDYLFCFYEIASTAKNPKLRDEATRLAHAYAKQWAAERSRITAVGNITELSDLVFGWYTASLLGEDDSRIKPQLRSAIARIPPADFLMFDPAKEAPPTDIPRPCQFDHWVSPRGSTVCQKCGRPLILWTKYELYQDALIMTHTGDRYGISLGRSYRDVLKWLPEMRPYLSREQTTQDNFLDILYTLTHLVYTLNDYNRYLLPRDLLPQEFSFLKQNLPAAIALHDPESMGEFLDTLKSFGLNDKDEVIRTGITYLLDTQRPDGTWSPKNVTDTYTLYHSAWTAIDGLKDCRWEGERITFPELRPLLDSMRN